mgnify:CR=1 FL=1
MHLPQNARCRRCDGVTQTVERRKLTAAVSKLDISDETIGAVKSIDQALAGQIAGLSVSPTSGAPGAPAKIRIRGTASLNGTQDPFVGAGRHSFGGNGCSRTG